MSDQPKLCECGCGEPAPIADRSDRKRGYVRGEPRSFIRGHHARVMTPEVRQRIADGHRGLKRSAETRRKMSEAQRNRPPEWRAKISESLKGKVMPGETRRKISLALGGTGETGATAIHQWLSNHYPKTGLCEECGKAGKTDYAFQRHPEPYTTDREDYRELCHSCHQRLDAWLRRPK